MSLTIVEADFAKTLSSVQPGSVQLVCTDPPFGTGAQQKLKSSGLSYNDPSVNKVVHMMISLGAHAKYALKPSGVLAVLLDYRAVHKAHVALERFLTPLGEIVWHFETGGLSKSWWSNKHNTILLFGPRGGTPKFNFEALPTVERKAPKAGYTEPKKISSVWNINMSTTDPQRVGYPTQKPEELFRRLVLAHSDPGDLVVDPFAGSGTLGAVGKDREVLLGDSNPEAVKIMKGRFNA